MMKEKQIRTIIPFLIVFLSTYFLSDAELFEDFGSRLVIVKANLRLLGLLITGDAMLASAALIIAVVFFKSWYNNRLKSFWFNELMWQLSGAFFCWFVSCVFSMIGTAYTFLWLSGMFRLFTGIFMMYVANTVLLARRKMYYPETPQQMQQKAEAFMSLRDTINKLADRIKKEEQ